MEKKTHMPLPVQAAANYLGLAVSTLNNSVAPGAAQSFSSSGEPSAMIRATSTNGSRRVVLGVLQKPLCARPWPIIASTRDALRSFGIIRLSKLRSHCAYTRTRCVNGSSKVCHWPIRAGRS